MSHTLNSASQPSHSQYTPEKNPENYAYCHSHGETPSTVRDSILLRWECSLCHPQSLQNHEN